MDLWTSLAVFIVIWWLVIFMVMPWSAQQIEPDDQGGKPGEDGGVEGQATAKQSLVMRLIVTTAISAVIFALVYLIVTSGVISLG